MSSRYVLVDSEVLLEDESRDRKVLEALEVWQKEESCQEGDLCSLAALNIEANLSYASLHAKLVSSANSPFGELAIFAKEEGIEYRLGKNHQSDHVVLGSQWFPLFPDELLDIKRRLEEIGIAVCEPLNARQYLKCINLAEEAAWLSLDHFYSAKEWAESFAPSETPAPSSFTATLYDYQSVGSQWISSMISQGVGVVLGDGMGLGKTIQIIRAICDLLDENPYARILVICPSAVVENWKREIFKFTTGITVLCHFGPDRTRDYHKIMGQVVITTYDVARIDSTVLNQIQWSLIVLDEAQAIKNPDSQRARSIKQINRQAAVAVTGTPFENHVTDLWSLFDFCMPGYLGTKQNFVSRFKDEETSASVIGKLIAPLLLRRKLDDIPNDLPELIKIPMPIRLSQQEALDYEMRRKAHIAQGASIGAIQKLVGDLAIPQEQSGISNLKYEYLQNVAEEVIDYGEKIIVFIERLAAIEAIREIYSKAIPVLTLTGSTPVQERQTVVDQFSSIDGAAMLLCNPTVGGAGLNITAANHVFHFSPQWNPAKFDQADARAHRKGQKKPVIAHYPFYAGTIEEYMWEKTETKRELSSIATVGNKGTSSADEIMEALSYSPL